MKTGVDLKLFGKKKKARVLNIIWKLKSLKIGKKNLKMGVLKTKFENWNFGKLFENGSFEY